MKRPARPAAKFAATPPRETPLGPSCSFLRLPLRLVAGRGARAKVHRLLEVVPVVVVPSYAAETVGGGAQRTSFLHNTEPTRRRRQEGRGGRSWSPPSLFSSRVFWCVDVSAPACAVMVRVALLCPAVLWTPRMRCRLDQFPAHKILFVSRFLVPVYALWPRSCCLRRYGV